MSITPLDKIGLKYTYDSDHDNLLYDFYLPALSSSNRYDRAVGFFSSGILKYIASALVPFIESGGTIRLIIGDPLEEKEFEAIKAGQISILKNSEQKLLDILREENSKAVCILKYLIAAKKLDIKFAFRKQGMFHHKTGVLYDSYGNKVVFQGSINESPSAFLKEINSEEVSIFPSWSESYLTHGQSYKKGFEKLWENQNPDTYVVSLNDHFYQSIHDSVDFEELRRKIFMPRPKTSSNVEEPPSSSLSFKYTIDEGQHELESEPEVKRPDPKIPTHIAGNEFKLFSHQEEAIKNWKKNSHHGIFELATGSGKTITAITALVQTFLEHKAEGKKLAAIISVPYVALAEQWLNELSTFSIDYIPCYSSRSAWVNSANRRLRLFTNNRINFMCLVVVNATFQGHDFQNLISQFDPNELFFIGDECHHLSSELLYESLPNSKYRIGLSATPYRRYDDEIETTESNENQELNLRKERLLDYFSDIIYQYSLKGAINDNVLTPYEYHIIPVHLNKEEQQDYDELSHKIGRLIAISRSTGKPSNGLNVLASQRARIIASCANKLPALDSLLAKLTPIKKLKHTIVYVGEGNDSFDNRNLENVTKILDKHNIKTSKFTSEESPADRHILMQDFVEKNIDALAAMKVLDEGIDVPVCETAIILASTRNPRQYIQRRGRVLRKFPGKDKAFIYDFVVLPHPGGSEKYAKRLIEAEMDRVHNFKDTAINIAEIEQMIEELNVKFIHRRNTKAIKRN